MSSDTPTPNVIVDPAPAPLPVASGPAHLAAPSVDNLGSIITNPTARQVIYGGYVIALLVAGAALVYFSSARLGIPGWLSSANDVLNYLGIPVGGLALANTKAR